MIALAGLSPATWAGIVIIALPALIIGVGELEERLRQRDSPYRDAIAILRVWVVPLIAVWILSRTLFETAPDNVGLRVLDSAVVVALAAVLLSALRVVITRYTDRPRRRGHRAVPRLLLAVPRLLVFLFAAWLLIAGVWGVDLSAALTALGVTSLVISFALQDTLGGIASGFTLLADQPFSAGDWIESDDVEGLVIDVNWRSTRIQNRDGDLVVVPNGLLSKATIVNYDQPNRFHRLSVLVQVQRVAPPTAAKAMLTDAARSTPGVLADPAPVVFVTNIADPVVDYLTHFWIDDYSIAPRVMADFRSLVWYLSYRHDVPLPNPAQDIYLFDGKQTALDSQVPPAEIRRALIGAPLIAEMSESVVDHLATGATIHSYQAGETIVVEGRQHDVFVLDRGQARIILRGDGRPDLHVLDLAAGEVFGVMDDPPGADHEAHVVALSDCRVVHIPSSTAGSVVGQAGEWTAALDQLALSRRRRCDRALRRERRGDVSAGPAARARAVGVEGAGRAADEPHDDDGAAP